MPKSTIDAQIRARIESFTHELAELVKQAAVESVQEALKSGSPTRTTKAKGRPRLAKTSSRVAKRAPARSGRRSPKQVEAAGNKILAHVKANQGQRLEEIGAALKVPTKDLKRPITNLLEAKTLRTTGQKRGTKYFAGSAGATKNKAKRKTAKKRATRK